MKPLLEGRTPTQLLWIIAAPNALVSIGFATPFVQSWQHHRGTFSQNFPWFAALLVGFIARGNFKKAARRFGQLQANFLAQLAQGAGIIILAAIQMSGSR